MKRLAEITVFAGLAALVHVAFFASAPPSGVQSSGAGGDAMISIQAAPDTVAKMVEAWERPQAPPQIETETALPPSPVQAPALPQTDIARAPRAQAQVPMARPQARDQLNVDSASPPPPPPEREQKPAPDPQPQARTAARSSAGQAEQRAAGSGGGRQAGQSGTAEATTAGAGRQAELRNIWGAKIRARVERRKRYPAGTKGSARVVVKLTVASSGRLVSSRIAKSSGIAAFDQAALQAVARAGTFPAAPKKLQASQISFNLPMSFSK